MSDSDRPDEPPPSDGERPARRRRGRLASLLVFLAILAASIAGATLYLVHETWTGPGPLAAETTVIIPRGASGGQIAAILGEAGAVEDPRLFRLALRTVAKDRPLKAGEYRLPAGVAMRDLTAKLQDGDTVVRRVTIPEGRTTAEALALLQAAPGMEGDLPPAEEVGEGAILPETYHYSWGDSRGEVLARMRAAMQAAVAAQWAERTEGLPLDTPEQAVVLASIVERETAVAAERPRVAAVFVNRLNRGMRLQSDPTVAYGLHDGGGLDRPLTRRDLQTDHPWNTYTRDGLPPSPIANPGLASLAAVMNPAESDELYFVADGTGGHAFARTLAEHNRNVARWRRIQRQQRAD